MWTHRCPDCLNACDCPGDAEHCSHDCDADRMPQPCSVLIEFTRAWGHPTRNEIYGPPQRARVSERIARILCRESDAYAKRVQA